jgi:nucleoside-diphosphate-sugar epimerase
MIQPKMMQSGFGKVVVTGASGFVGHALCGRLLDEGIGVIAVGRSKSDFPSFADRSFTQIQVGEIGPSTVWAAALDGVEVVIHLAARVHVMHESALDPLAEFRSVNTAGTEHLARCAAASGVKRMVYVSSIKVNGEQTHDGQAFSESDIPAPQDPYGVSKWEAERALHRVSSETGLEIVIVRPPLVYGPGVKGNFAQMLKVVARGMPLPFGSLRNQRSLIYLGNLVDALIACATHSAAAGQTYLVCDGEDVSTPGLLRELAVAMHAPSRLLPCPATLLRLAGKLVGKSQQVERLLGSLQVDGGKMRHDLNWMPPYSLRQGLQATADWYRTRHT